MEIYLTKMMTYMYCFLLLISISMLGMLMTHPRKERSRQKHPANYRKLDRFEPHQKDELSAQGHKNTTEQRVKSIVCMTPTKWMVRDLANFSECPYSNCKLEGFKNARQANYADMLLFNFDTLNKVKLNKIKWTRRSEQYWTLFSWESPLGYPNFKWHKNTNNQFNVTATHRTDSEIYMPYARTVPRREGSPPVDWSVLSRKTKGAFAYVSHCNTLSYNRLKIMEALRKYIEVDIFGKCTGLKPCKQKHNTVCESSEHSKYMFYLSFENSLCRDYITEKFWYRLQAPGMFVPVALGGTSLDEYERVAPPNSYIHLYNFTSIEKLGMYLRQLVTNKALYERYHTWRDRFEIESGRNLCKLCQLANEKPHIRPMGNVMSWWNNPKGCRKYHPPDIQ